MPPAPSTPRTPVRPLLATALATALLVGVATPALAETVIVRDENIIGDSALDFSTTQGANGWNYGYFNLGADGNLDPGDLSFLELPVQGNGYRLVPSNAPWTLVNPNNSGHPNGTNSAPNEEHWAVRRYTVEEAGAAEISWFVREENLNGTGVTGRLFFNGVEIDSATIPGGDGVGVSRTINRGIAVGDVIDFVLTPEGPDNDDTDGSDGSLWGGQVAFVQETVFNNAVRVADSVADFGGTQGLNNWFYGYYDIAANGVPSAGNDSFIPFPRDGTDTFSATNFWDGSKWDWFEGNPPWTEVSAAGGHPSGDSATNPVQWATRRYEIQEDGLYVVEWDLAKTNLNGAGVAIQVLHNGEQIGFNQIAGGDGAGITDNVIITASAGDFIDFGLSPENVDGTQSDGADGSNFGGRIYAVPEPSTYAALAGLAALGAAALRRRRRG